MYQPIFALLNFWSYAFDFSGLSMIRKIEMKCLPAVVWSPLLSTDSVKALPCKCHNDLQGLSFYKHLDCDTWH